MTQPPRRSAIAIALAGLVALAVAMGIGRSPSRRSCR